MNKGRSSARSDFKFKLFIWCYLHTRRKFCKVRATGEYFLKYRCVPFSILSSVNFEILMNGQFQNVVEPARVRDYGRDGRGWCACPSTQTPPFFRPSPFLPESTRNITMTESMENCPQDACQVPPGLYVPLGLNPDG